MAHPYPFAQPGLYPGMKAFLEYAEEDLEKTRRRSRELYKKRAPRNMDNIDYELEYECDCDSGWSTKAGILSNINKLNPVTLTDYEDPELEGLDNCDDAHLGKICYEVSRYVEGRHKCFSPEYLRLLGDIDRVVKRPAQPPSRRVSPRLAEKKQKSRKSEYRRGGLYTKQKPRK